MAFFNKDKKDIGPTDDLSGVLQVKASTKLEIRKVSNQIGKLESVRDKMIELCRQAKQKKDPIIYNIAAKSLKITVNAIMRAQQFIPQAEMMLMIYEQQQDDSLPSVIDNVSKRMQNLFKDINIFAGMGKVDDIWHRLEESTANQEAAYGGMDAMSMQFEVDPEVEALIKAATSSAEEISVENVRDENKSFDNELSELKKLNGLN